MSICENEVLFSSKISWYKKGLIFKPKGQYGWMNSHAQVPTVLCLPLQNIVRVYFATRPRQDLSLTTYVDLNASDLSEIIFLNPTSILELGGIGMFDEHGIMPSSVVKHDSAVFLYYSGWSRSTSLPYSNFTGLAISEDDGKSFKKLGKGPILDRKHWGPYSATSPHVIKNGNSWLMYYCSGTDWIDVDGKLEHVYDIKIAESHDGINWEQSGKVAIPQNTKDEAITKPTIYFDGQIYHMYFCYRKSDSFRGGKNSYQIGYAQSINLVDWKRDDTKAGISKGPNEWDSKMLAYPEVYSSEECIFMFYNGNNFGATGFGLATSKD